MCTAELAPGPDAGCREDGWPRREIGSQDDRAGGMGAVTHETTGNSLSGTAA